MNNDYQYCRFCGSKLGINDTVCRGCGRDLTILANEVVHPDTEISTITKIGAIMLCIVMPILALSLGISLSLVEQGSKKKLGHLLLIVTTGVFILLM